MNGENKSWYRSVWMDMPLFGNCWVCLAICLLCLSILLFGCVEISPELEARLDSKIDAKFDAEISGVKNDLQLQLEETLAGESTQTTGSWGVSIGTLKVDSLTLVLLIVGVAVIGYLLYKKGKLGKVIDIIVNRVEAHDDPDHKRFIEEDAKIAGVNTLLDAFVKRNTENHHATDTTERPDES